jgi:uncharacterized membrane protein
MDSHHNVVVVNFEESSKTYQALSVMKRLDAEGRVGVESAALVEREADGTIRVPEDTDNVIGVGFFGGSLIGMLIGVLGGPVGMLFGWGAGALAGGLGDLERGDAGEEVLDRLAQTLKPGQTALIAEVEEDTAGVVDDEMHKLGGTVVRYTAEEVLAALEAAEEVARAAEKEARRVRGEQRKADFEAKRKATKEEWDERLKTLKRKLSHDDVAEAKA